MNTPTSPEILQRALVALKDARRRLTLLEEARREPIAIVGMGCRFPGSSNSLQTYWDLLVGRREGIRDVPRDRWPAERFYAVDGTEPGKMRFRRGGFIDAPDQFDPAFFEISPREAAYMDPQQRLMLQVASEAIEDAGIVTKTLKGSRTGVWAGVNSNDYLHLQTLNPRNLDTYSIIGGAGSIVANRLSYLLDLRGPSMSVDTACSTALVAVSLASQSLRNGECDVAIAGAVNLILSPLLTMAHARGMPMASDDRCKTFDARADGYVRGEGCGAIVLKRLSDAVRDGDAIWATIRGFAVNQDGRTNGLTAPSGLAQQDVIRQALSSGDIDPHTVRMIEAHGTGTVLGDPIEVEALRQVYESSGSEAPCLLGSVKTNLGHLESAAGMAGLIKVALSLHHRQVPPVLNFERLNPHIELDPRRFEIPTEVRPWPEGTRRGAVSSFGAGGTNAHVVMEQAPALEVSDPKSALEQLVVVSSRTEAGLHANAAALASWLDANPATQAHDLAFTTGRRRTLHEHRAVVRGTGGLELAGALRALGSSDAVTLGQAPTTTTTRRRVVFVCSGHGSQWPGMAQDLLECAPAFSAELERCHRAIQRHAGWSLLDHLRSADATDATFDVVQPTLWAIEVALAAQWAAWGVRPDLLIGHSFGELAAAAIGGALSLEDAAQVACRRSALMAPHVGHGGMLLLTLPPSEVEARIARWSDHVSIAVVNGPGTTVVSGQREAIDEIEATLADAPFFWRRISADIAAHSVRMEPLREQLVEQLELRPQTPTVPTISTVDPSLDPLGVRDASYWGRNLRERVRFGEATERALELGHDVFVELSPHGILAAAIEQTAGATAGATADRTLVLTSMSRDTPGVETMRAAWSGLLAHGHHPEGLPLLPESGQVLRLPNYQWNNRSYWFTEDRWSALEAHNTADPQAEHRRALSDACSRLQWVERTAERTCPNAAWLVIGLGRSADAVVAELKRRTFAVERVDSVPAADDAVWARLKPAWVLDVARLEASTDGVVAAARGTTALLATLERLRRVASASPRLWVLTARAWSASAPCCAAAALWGLARTLAIESPECLGGLVDLECGTEDARWAAQVIDALSVDDREDQLRIDAHGTPLIPRVVAAPELALAPEGLDGSDAACTLLVGSSEGALRTVDSQLADLGHSHRLWLTKLGNDAPEGATRVDAAGLDRALRDHAAAGRPLTTVIHVGACWTPCPSSELGAPLLTAALIDYCSGVERLLNQLAEHPVQRCVLVTSVASSWGSMGMAHAGAASAYVEAVARRVRAAGRPCTVVESTPWQAGNMVDDATLQDGARIGVEPIEASLSMAMLRRTAMLEFSPVVLATVDWSRLRPVYEARRPRPFLADLGRATSVGVNDGELRRELEAQPAAERRNFLARALTDRIATLLGHDPSVIEPRTGFFALGMDSIMAVQLVRRLATALGITIPASTVFEYPTVARLSDFVLAKTGLGGPGRPVLDADAVALQARLCETAQLSEQDLLDALERELN